MKLSKELREQMTDVISVCWRENRFGDGQEMEMIYEGVRWKGLNEMTQSEIVDEYESIVDQDDELLMKVKFELAVEEELNQDCIPKELTPNR